MMTSTDQQRRALRRNSPMMEGIWLLTAAWVVQLIATDPQRDTLWWAWGGLLFFLHAALRLG